MVRTRMRGRQTFSLADETTARILEVAEEVERRLNIRFHAGNVIDVACLDISADAVIAAIARSEQYAQDAANEPTAGTS